MTPEEEQKLRNFRLLGGGSSMELPQQQQQQPTAPLLGQGAGEQGMSPELLTGLGLGGGIVAGQAGGAPSTSMRLSPFAQRIADLDASRLAQQGRPNLIGTPQTTTTTPRMVGPNTTPQYTGPSPARPVPGTQMVPTGQSPAVGSRGGSPAVRPAQVTSVNTAPKGGPPALLGQASKLSRAAGPTALYTLADVGVEAATGQGISSRVGEGLGGLIGSAIYGDTSQPAFTQEELDASIANNPQQTIDLGTLERQSAQAQEESAPAPEATFLSQGQIKTIMPGEQVQSAFPYNYDTSLKPGFDVDGQPRFQGTDLPDGIGFQRAPEGMVKSIGPDGKMIFTTQEEANRIASSINQEQAEATAAQQRFLQSPESDAMSSRMIRSVQNSPFEQASAEREARTAERDRRPGESKTQRDTRIADSGKQGGASERDAAGLTQGDRRNILREQGIGGSAQVDAARQMGVENNQKIENEQFEPREFEIGGQKYIQLSPNYIQPVPQEEAPFEPRTREINGVTYVEESPGRFKPLPSQGTDTADAETLAPILGDQGRIAFNSEEEAEASNLPAGTKITVNGRNATIQ